MLWLLSVLDVVVDLTGSDDADAAGCVGVLFVTTVFFLEPEGFVLALAVS